MKHAGITWWTVLLAVLVTGAGLTWCQIFGYYRARRFDNVGKTYVYQTGWPLVYSEYFYPAASRAEALAPRWRARIFVNLICTLIGTAAAFGAERLVSSRLRFRLGALFTLAAVVGGLLVAAPLERSLLTPGDDWGFTWSTPPNPWRDNWPWNLPMVAASTLALGCVLYAAVHFCSRAIRAFFGARTIADADDNREGSAADGDRLA